MPIPLYSIQDLFIAKGGEDKLTIKQFDIHRGACYVFEGRMGSGKTTFLDVLYNRRKTQRGNITFEEKDIQVQSTAAGQSREAAQDHFIEKHQHADTDERRVHIGECPVMDAGVGKWKQR